jgi:inner membrane protease subunit 2
MAHLWWRMAAAGGIAGVVVTDRYGEFCSLKGPSMLPTIQAHGDVGLLNRRCLAGYEFSRGDVVVFRSPAVCLSAVRPSLVPWHFFVLIGWVGPLI